MIKREITKRVMLDSNIYGLILEEFHQNLIKEATEKGVLKGYFVIYGLDLIRKELRATSNSIKIGDTKIRIALLNLYDILVTKHNLSVNSEMSNLAIQSYNVYKELGGLVSEQEILNDFIIVACASIKNLDIVYSNDSKTMVSEKAIKSYEIVNKILKIRTPKFEDYSNFIKEIRRLST